MMVSSSHDTKTPVRARYPARLLQRVAEQTGFSYRVSALDLSDDAGALAVELARLARTVTVALDDDSDSDATAETIQRHRARVQLRMGGPTELAAEGARYFLVTIGRALHQRDGSALLRTLDALVERRGAVVVLGTRYPRMSENAWRHQLDRHASSSGDDADEALLLGSSFDLLERVSVFERGTLSVDDAVHQLRTRVAAGMSADELRARVRAHADRDGQLPQVIEGHALIARRHGDRTGRWS